MKIGFNAYSSQNCKMYMYLTHITFLKKPSNHIVQKKGFNLKNTSINKNIQSILKYKPKNYLNMDQYLMCEWKTPATYLKRSSLPSNGNSYILIEKNTLSNNLKIYSIQIITF